MGWIKNRILAEERKHYRITGGCDWALIAEKKILGTLKEKIKEITNWTCECRCVTFDNELCRLCGRPPKYGSIDYEELIRLLIDKSQQVNKEDKGNTSPSPPSRNVNESLEGGCDEEFLAPADDSNGGQNEN